MFGRNHDQGHNAPGFAVCAGGTFSAWASSGIASLRLQDRAFSNVTWAFSVQGRRLIGNLPLVRLSPQRLVADSAFHVEVELSWGTPAQPGQIQLQSFAWLQVGDRDRLRVENDHGLPLETVGVTHDGIRWATLSRSLQTIAGRRRQCIDFIIAPEPTLQRQVASMDLMHARIAVRLSAFGRGNQDLMVPLPAPGADRNALNYTIVELDPNAALPGVTSQSGVPAATFNTREELSLSAYT